MDNGRAVNNVLSRTEAVGLLFFIFTSFFIFHYDNGFEKFVDFVEEYKQYRLGEIIFSLLLSGIGGFYYAVRSAVVLGREIRRREDAESAALQLARHDPLTGLPNRRMLGSELASCIQAKAPCSILLVDLDHFKPVNDLHGHEVGDQLLAAVANRLRTMGALNFISRLSGDEFACIVKDRIDHAALSRVASQIVRELSEPFTVDGRKITIGATIGIARFPEDFTAPEDLLRAADLAMYEAKRAGRGGYHFFHTDLDARLRLRAQLEAEVRGALRNGEIKPYFQPVIHLADGIVGGFEALARWEHPEKGLIAPDTFVPILEDLGLADDLMVVILEGGCRAAERWPTGTSLSINVSPFQLHDPSLAQRIIELLERESFSPKRLIVEVTENAIIEDIERAAAIFQALRAVGIRIALDDFGKGYSSLTHLRQLHFNHIKIDSSFVRTMDSIESRKIIKAVAALGKALGMPVTAEGVETREAAEVLRALGCENAQGYYFGRAQPSEAIEFAELATFRRSATRAG